MAWVIVCRFSVPRPRALLGDSSLRTVLELVDRVRGLWPSGTYQTMRLSAAGAESAVMLRLRRAVAARSSLLDTSTGGDLEIRVRPAAGGAGWEVLVRLGPRPLATRAWRLCNLPGALDAPTAHAMALLTRPTAHDVFLNPACGSGTLLIERLACSPARRAIGCEISSRALACAARNIAASGCGRGIEIAGWDACDMPLPDRSVDAVCCDLPFGHLVGSHEENVRLYPSLLREAARVARRGAPVVLLTQEVRLLERVLVGCSGLRLEQSLPVRLCGAHRRLVVLRRR